jgi:hypothetical protein
MLASTPSQHLESDFRPSRNPTNESTFGNRALSQGKEPELKELLAAYERDGGAEWLYTRALLAFREGNVGEARSVALVRNAWSANEHVPAILAGTKRPIAGDSANVTVGGVDEASYYAAEFGPALAPHAGRCRMADQDCLDLAAQAASKSDQALSD